MIVSVMYMFCPNYFFIAHVIHVLCASNCFASSLCGECGRCLYARGIYCNVCAIIFRFWVILHLQLWLWMSYSNQVQEIIGHCLSLRQCFVNKLLVHFSSLG